MDSSMESTDVEVTRTVNDLELFCSFNGIKQSRSSSNDKG